tara:strand:+ start:95 stop:616 length:522 start_codon:yes stop_codon:yes gene_type:complete
MTLIELAQIITGTATMIFALILLIEVRIQLKTLKLSNKDADRELTYRSLEMMYSNFKIIIENNEFREIYSKRFQGLSKFSDSERIALENYYFMFFGQINTDYRLGRLSNEDYYYRLVFNWVLDSKSGQEWYLKSGRKIFENTPKKGRKEHLQFLQGIGDEVYEKITGTSVIPN